MQRIKYTKVRESKENTIESVIYDIFGNKIFIFITNPKWKSVNVLVMCKEKNTMYHCTSVQTAKRKVRQILKQMFQVNLQDEVRSKIEL